MQVRTKKIVFGEYQSKWERKKKNAEQGAAKKALEDWNQLAEKVGR